MIQKTFAHCHLGSVNTEREFKKIIENEKTSFSRYYFFFANYLFNNEEKYDLAFNSDSFTEIDTLSQVKYVNFISEKTKYFYSINHESNKNKVSDLFAKKKVNEFKKNLYWLRKGYLEEHFKF